MFMRLPYATDDNKYPAYDLPAQKHSSIEVMVAFTDRLRPPSVATTFKLYFLNAWTLTLREEQRLRVFENKVLRKIFGAKRDEVTGEWRKLHNAELHALYSSPDIIRNIKSRRLRWAGHVARMGESRNAYRVLVGRPAGKRPLERPRRRWEDNIKMDLREVGYDGRDWINLAQDRDQWRAYVRATMNLRSLKANKREEKRREEKRREEKRREEKRREEKRREEKRREEKRREEKKMLERYWIFCGHMEKELRNRLVQCFVWSVAFYGAETWKLR
ncbi:hypothetical protein ANN_27132 [Periplaneta americana]|uniref:Uncharacterized protein n=1 Tax=Periplaneta americana TaxID=6978 RepID=A0ABQ8RXB3_PERAM|nr:hypothetical protein ANN_27132 [Periplaneta americana]